MATEGSAQAWWRIKRGLEARDERAAAVLYAVGRRGVRTARFARFLAEEGRFVPTGVRALAGSDLLVFTGGGLGDSFLGPWNQPYLVFRWAELARRSGAEVAFAGVGLGPLSSPVSRALIRRAMSLAGFRSFRDEGSRFFAEEIGVRSPERVVPDLAFSLPVPPLPPPRGATESGGATVGVTLYPVEDTRYVPGGDDARYGRYVECMAELVASLLAPGHRVHFVPTQVLTDPRVIDDVVARLSGTGVAVDRIERPPVAGVSELIREIDRCDLMVAGRFHGIVLSLLRARPVLGVVDQPKMAEVLGTFGQEEWVVWAQNADAADLSRRVDDLLQRREEIARRLEIRAGEARAAVESDLDAIFPPLQSRGA